MSLVGDFKFLTMSASDFSQANSILAEFFCLRQAQDYSWIILEIITGFNYVSRVCLQKGLKFEHSGAFRTTA
jgi:hypothetical protein